MRKMILIMLIIPILYACKDESPTVIATSNSNISECVKENTRPFISVSFDENYELENDLLKFNAQFFVHRQYLDSTKFSSEYTNTNDANIIMQAWTDTCATRFQSLFPDTIYQPFEISLTKDSTKIYVNDTILIKTFVRR